MARGSPYTAPCRSTGISTPGASSKSIIGTAPVLPSVSRTAACTICHTASSSANFTSVFWGDTFTSMREGSMVR